MGLAQDPAEKGQEASRRDLPDRVFQRAADEAKAAKVSFDESGKIIKMQENDWFIHFKRYTTVDNKSLPTKLFLENHEFDVRLVVQSWQI